MSDARRYAVWPEPTSRSRSLKGSRPSVPHGTNFFLLDSAFKDKTELLYGLPREQIFFSLAAVPVTQTVHGQLSDGPLVQGLGLGSSKVIQTAKTLPQRCSERS